MGYLRRLQGLSWPVSMRTLQCRLDTLWTPSLLVKMLQNSAGVTCAVYSNLCCIAVQYGGLLLSHSLTLHFMVLISLQANNWARCQEGGEEGLSNPGSHVSVLPFSGGLCFHLSLALIMPAYHHMLIMHSLFLQCACFVLF